MICSLRTGGHRNLLRKQQVEEKNWVNDQNHSLATLQNLQPHPKRKRTASRKSAIEGRTTQNERLKDAYGQRTTISSLSNWKSTIKFCQQEKNSDWQPEQQSKRRLWFLVHAPKWLCKKKEGFRAGLKFVGEPERSWIKCFCHSGVRSSIAKEEVRWLIILIDIRDFYKFDFLYLMKIFI